VEDNSPAKAGLVRSNPLVLYKREQKHTEQRRKNQPKNRAKKKKSTQKQRQKTEKTTEKKQSINKKKQYIERRREQECSTQGGALSLKLSSSSLQKKSNPE
jgi:hypothetical protein